MHAYVRRETNERPLPYLILSYLATGVTTGRWRRKFHPSACPREMGKPMHRLAAASRIALLRSGRVQIGGRQQCILEVLFQKHRKMRELVSIRMCLASERVDVLEVDIAVLG
jgi:hypothetical protein